MNSEKLADQWRRKLRGEGLAGRITETSDFERICPRCGAINPCTGVDHCTSCNASLRGARRSTTSRRFDPRHY